MNVTVQRKLTQGRVTCSIFKRLPPIGGPLCEWYKPTGGGKTIKCMRVHDIHGQENIELYNARFAGLKDNTISWIGSECVENAWHVQQWDMTITSIDPVPPRPGAR